MMFTAGYARFGRWGAAPLRWHWSLPLGMAMAGAWELAPLAWLLFFGVVLAHEAGHHATVRRVGLRVVGVDLQGLGGEVRWNGVATPKEQVQIAWSGVLAQLGVLIAAEVVLAVAGGASSPWLATVERVCVHVNAVMIGLNLLPIPTFDGEVAWKLIPLLRGRRIEERRAILLHVVPPDAPDEDRVRAEVEAELEQMTRAHNEQADSKADVRSSRWG